jgi:hypothetical protein
MALTKEQAKIWIEALESGKYKQAFCEMVTLDGRCCALGVACDLFVDNNMLKYKTEKAYKIYDEKYQQTLDLIGNSLCAEITFWNDFKELSFKDIAFLSKRGKSSE